MLLKTDLMFTKADLQKLNRLHGYKDPIISSDVSMPTTQNIVCKVDYQVGDTTGISLLKVLRWVFASYKLPKFAALTLRKRSATIQVFAGGKCVIVGAKSLDTARLVAQEWRLSMRKIGIPAGFGDFVLTNRVCNGSVNHAIEIDGFENRDGIGCVNKASFPGIYYFVRSPRYPTKRFMFLIFDTGKFINMGLTTADDEEVREAFQLILPVLHQNRKESTCSPDKQLDRLQAKFADSVELQHMISVNDTEEDTELATRISAHMRDIVTQALQI